MEAESCMPLQVAHKMEANSLIDEYFQFLVDLPESDEEDYHEEDYNEEALDRFDEQPPTVREKHVYSQSSARRLSPFYSQLIQLLPHLEVFHQMKEEAHLILDCENIPAQKRADCRNVSKNLTRVTKLLESSNPKKPKDGIQLLRWADHIFSKFTTSPLSEDDEDGSSSCWTWADSDATETQEDDDTASLRTYFSDAYDTLQSRREGSPGFWRDLLTRLRGNSSSWTATN